MRCGLAQNAPVNGNASIGLPLSDESGQFDFDWVTRHALWMPRADHRFEAVFALKSFLLLSRTDRDNVRLDFLAWKCERLAQDALWFDLEIRVGHEHGDVWILRGL